MKEKQATVTLLPNGTQARFSRGTLLLDALSDMGVILKTPCGGKGFCGKCGVRCEGDIPPKTPVEKKLYPESPDMRLACQFILDGDLAVHSTVLDDAARHIVPHVPVDADYSIAVDIGTTTLQISLVINKTGEIFRMDSYLNPQRRHGHDVISRISASSDINTFNTLTGLVRNHLSSLIEEICTAGGLNRERLSSISLSGNTTMLYFLLGIDVRPLGVYPYRAAVRDFGSYAAAGIGFGAFPNADVRVIPIASSFLGGDLVGGLAVSESLGFTDHTLFIDLGTNGEIFVRNHNSEIFSTSCAMGPALEGMNMSHGMTADTGAITHVETDSSGLVLSVMGDQAPRGICGTGIIDALAVMLREGILKKQGNFSDLRAGQSPFFAEGIIIENGVRKIAVHRDVFISQRDVRNIQLAKGASLAATRILLRKARISPGQIRHVLIAGAFGENLNIENFRRLKFLPDFPGALYHFLGNTSLAAAEKSALSRDFLDTAGHLRDRITIVELSDDPEFNSEFIECLEF